MLFLLFIFSLNGLYGTQTNQLEASLAFKGILHPIPAHLHQYLPLITEMAAELNTDKVEISLDSALNDGNNTLQKEKTVTNCINVLQKYHNKQPFLNTIQFPDNSADLPNYDQFANHWKEHLHQHPFYKKHFDLNHPTQYWRCKRLADELPNTITKLTFKALNYLNAPQELLCSIFNKLYDTKEHKNLPNRKSLREKYVMSFDKITWFGSTFYLNNLGLRSLMGAKAFEKNYNQDMLSETNTQTLCIDLRNNYIKTVNKKHLKPLAKVLNYYTTQLMINPIRSAEGEILIHTPTILLKGNPIKGNKIKIKPLVQNNTKSIYHTMHDNKQTIFWLLSAMSLGVITYIIGANNIPSPLNSILFIAATSTLAIFNKLLNKEEPPSEELTHNEAEQITTVEVADNKYTFELDTTN